MTRPSRSAGGASVPAACATSFTSGAVRAVTQATLKAGFRRGAGRARFFFFFRLALTPRL